MSGVRIATVFACCAIIAFTLCGCERTATIEYIPEGGSYARTDLEDVARAVDIEVLADVEFGQISDTRQAYLASLRGHGPDANRLADTLTRDFPLDTAAVPVLVEDAVLDGAPVWLIVEAWAEDGGVLEHRRLWIFDRETLDLRDSLSFR